jgi:hypothetical protein
VKPEFGIQLHTGPAPAKQHTKFHSKEIPQAHSISRCSEP